MGRANAFTSILWVLGHGILGWIYVIYHGGPTAMIDLYDSATNQPLGSVTEAELRFLVDALEEESPQDRDYYIDAATIDLLADGSATDHLLHLLRAALGSKEGVEIRWQPH